MPPPATWFSTESEARRVWTPDVGDLFNTLAGLPDRELEEGRASPLATHRLLGGRAADVDFGRETLALELGQHLALKPILDQRHGEGPHRALRLLHLERGRVSFYR